DREAGELAVAHEQLVEARCHRPLHRLHPRGAVDVGHGGELVAILRAHRKDSRHEAPEPPTWVTAASLSRYCGRTGKTPDMKRPSRAPPGGSSKYSAAFSIGTAGAKGRNSSRNLMLRLSLSRIEAGVGAARMLRAPSARGPS